LVLQELLQNTLARLRRTIMGVSNAKTSAPSTFNVTDMTGSLPERPLLTSLDDDSFLFSSDPIAANSHGSIDSTRVASASGSVSPTLQSLPFQSDAAADLSSSDPLPPPAAAAAAALPSCATIKPRTTPIVIPENRITSVSSPVIVRKKSSSKKSQQPLDSFSSAATTTASSAALPGRMISPSALPIAATTAVSPPSTSAGVSDTPGSKKRSLIVGVSDALKKALPLDLQRVEGELIPTSRLGKWFLRKTTACVELLELFASKLKVCQGIDVSSIWTPLDEGRLCATMPRCATTVQNYLAYNLSTLRFFDTLVVFAKYPGESAEKIYATYHLGYEVFSALCTMCAVCSFQFPDLSRTSREIY
jgi:hypothetical protein